VSENWACGHAAHATCSKCYDVLARRCAAAEARLARLVEAAKELLAVPGVRAYKRDVVENKLRAVLRELEESDGV